jgi:hypothetical protein
LKGLIPPFQARIHIHPKVIERPSSLFRLHVVFELN